MPRKIAPDEHVPPLFLRFMPRDVIDGLDAWVEELRATMPGGQGITRTDLARDILTRVVRGEPVPKRSRTPKRG